MNENTHRDFWLIACVPDGESILYIAMSDDAVNCDILLSGNWEEDNLILPKGSISPGVYKFKLNVTGGQDYPSGEYWTETSLVILETLWQLPTANKNMENGDV